MVVVIGQRRRPRYTLTRCSPRIAIVGMMFTNLLRICAEALRGRCESLAYEVASGTGFSHDSESTNGEGDAEDPY